MLPIVGIIPKESLMISFFSVLECGRGPGSWFISICVKGAFFSHLKCVRTVRLCNRAHDTANLNSPGNIWPVEVDVILATCSCFESHHDIWKRVETKKKAFGDLYSNRSHADQIFQLHKSKVGLKLKLLFDWVAETRLISSKFQSK